MCGIAGVIEINAATDSLTKQVRRMLDTLVHRGPDSSGCWESDDHSVCLGHRRLAIQDLSPLGHQPMISTSGRYIISFNGEIYNFTKLRQRLELQGCSFEGHSDTEVLLALIEEQGIKTAIKQCRGMFAFALFDQQTSNLHLCRDRLGEKPLYYGVVDGLLVFASELKAIWAIKPANKLAIDRDALASYLRYGYVSAPQSIFEEIRKLQPGHILSCKVDFSAGAPPTLESLADNSCAYWSADTVIEAANNNKYENTDTTTNELDGLLNKIIQEQSIADVSLGAFLSGGIDSSVVSAILQSINHQPIDTFTIGFNEPNFNEAEHASAVADHIGSTHHELYVSGYDVLDRIPDMPAMYDEPFADSSQLPMAIVSQLAKQNVTVCLSGDGGDELFAGYNRYVYTENLFRKIDAVPRAIRSLISSALKHPSPGTWDAAYKLLARVTGRKGSAAPGLKLHKLGAVLLQPDLASSYQYLCSYWQSPERLIVGNCNEPALMAGYDFASNFLNAALKWDQEWYLPGDNLVKSDRASMAVSLEMRLPLLDQELVEFAWRVPNSMKIKNKQSKWLLRQVLYRYVPQALIDRPKMGFSVPVAHWIRHELRDWAADLLEPRAIENQGLLNAGEINEIYRQHMSGKFDHSHKLWTVLMFQAWYRKNITNA